VAARRKFCGRELIFNHSHRLKVFKNFGGNPWGLKTCGRQHESAGVSAKIIDDFNANNFRV
jgi:hypothetical protein